MNTIDILLTNNKGIKKAKNKKFEIPRLTKEFGQKVVFTLKNLDNEQYNYVTEEATTIVEGQAYTDATKFKYLVVIESLVDPNIKDKRLKEKYKCAKNEEVLDKMLEPSEINMLFSEALTLTGINQESIREVVEEVKN